MSFKSAAGRISFLVALSLSLLVALGGGIASADDPYAGQTYKDASAAAAKSGTKVIIETVVGDVLATDDCVVTKSQKASGVASDNFTHRTGYLLALNCNAKLANGGAPGNSAASPIGRQAKKNADAIKWVNDTPEGTQWCTDNADNCKYLCDQTGSCSSETLALVS
ncbi:hypothetical protein ACXPWS_29595 [Mycobacterium sp. BMJ-28]